MFENYVQAKTNAFSKWAVIFIAVSVAVHVAGFGFMIVRGYWVIGKLPIPGSQASFATSPPPPPPPPPASKKKKKKVEVVKKKLIKVTETVQPVKDKPKLEDIEIIDPDEGVEGGVEGGDAAGVLGGLAPPPPPPPARPKVVPPRALNALRTAGESQIHPPDAVKNQIRRDMKSRIVAVSKLCLGVSGAVKSVRMIKSSGYPAYDRKIQSKMRAWRYKPFRVNGKPVPVCTSITFIYSQTN